MKGSRLDEAIDRYLSDAMSGGEREAFLDLLARDPEATRALETERAIRGALEADLRALPVDPLAGRDQLLDALSSLPATGAAAGTAATVAATSVSPMILTGIAALAIATATFVMHVAQSSETLEVPTPRTTSAQSSPVPQHDPAPAEARAATNVTPYGNDRHYDTQYAARSTRPARSTEPSRSTQPPHSTAPARSTPPTLDTTIATIAAPDTPEPAPMLPVVIRDSIDLEVRMERRAR